jgi:hypothetical protein
MLRWYIHGMLGGVHVKSIWKRSTFGERMSEGWSACRYTFVGLKALFSCAEAMGLLISKSIQYPCIVCLGGTVANVVAVLHLVLAHI